MKENLAGDEAPALKDKSQEDLEAHGSVLSYRYVAILSLSEACMLYVKMHCLASLVYSLSECKVSS